MIELRPCESDADLEAWRSVRISVIPYERTESVEELRRSLSAERLMLLAYRDGKLAGSGVAGRGDTASGFAIPRVLPEQRRRGVGTALLHSLAEHVQGLGFPDLGVGVDDGDGVGVGAGAGVDASAVWQVAEPASANVWPGIASKLQS